MGDSDDVRHAQDLGGQFFNLRTFVRACDACANGHIGAVIKERGVSLHIVLKNVVHDLSAYADYVTKRFFVHQHDVAMAFYSMQPITVFLQKVAVLPSLNLLNVNLLYGFLETLIVFGAPADRIACVVVPFLSKERSGRDVQQSLCSLLRVIVMRDPTTKMLHDERLVHELAQCFRNDNCRENVLDIVLETHLFRECLLVHPIVSKCVDYLYDTTARTHCLRSRPGAVEALKVLEGCAAESRMRGLIIQDVLYLSRHGWPRVYGPLLHNMLKGTSVEFVVQLHRSNRLVLLIEKAYAHQQGDDEWVHVYGALCKTCPTLVESTLKHDDLSTRAPVTTSCCPITLAPMLDPVVASDGHTYERDALMQHLFQNGMVSPMTKETVEYNLFSNFTCRNV